MLIHPNAEAILDFWWQSQDQPHKTERLKNLKITIGINNDMGSSCAQLLEGQRLARLVGKTRTSFGIGKEVIETITERNHQNIEDDLTVTRQCLTIQAALKLRSVVTRTMSSSFFFFSL